MPFILSEFIACHFAPCFSSIHKHVLVPYLDNVGVLDYVLRSSVVYSASNACDTNGIPMPKMYPELFTWLMDVESPVIQQYLVRTFGEDGEGVPSAGRVRLQGSEGAYK
jgi:hypothetical protein